MAEHQTRKDGEQGVSLASSPRCLTRNAAYELRHVDEDTGYGLLYAAAHDACSFLSPAAAALWQAADKTGDIDAAKDLLASMTNHPDADTYLSSVIRDMTVAGLLGDSTDTPATLHENTAEPNAKPLLTQLYLYATQDCNARCYHCYQPTTKAPSEARPPGQNEVNARSFAEVVDAAIPLGLRKIKITGGEALLRSDLRDLIRVGTDRRLKVSIETNAYLLDRSLARFLVDHGVDVSISLDGGTPDVHDRLRRHPGSFERATRALRLIADAGGRPYVIMSISRRNLNQVESVLEVAKANGCTLVKLNPVNTLGKASKLDGRDILLSSADIRDLYLRRQELEASYGTFLFVEGPPSFATIYELTTGHAAVCPFTNILGVLADGSISFCGLGYVAGDTIFGNIFSRTFDLAELWRDNPVLTEARRSLRENLEGICGNCILEPFCQGSCRALAYSRFHSFKAPHPWCQNAYDDGNFPAYYLRSPDSNSSIDSNALASPVDRSATATMVGIRIPKPT
jgi:SynChlorMet cassette radical SAM/SPASM protein ScmF